MALLREKKNIGAVAKSIWEMWGKFWHFGGIIWRLGEIWCFLKFASNSHNGIT
jgi:hypothetical protein